MVSSNDVRAQFLEYFARNGHEVVPSAPLVPRNDPTLLFTNAGMVPFKNLFTGQEKRSYVRATSAQKVVRAGGKHNDLDNVGYTARHHTFFEMLGNFSFGDYFKPLAIELAWTLVTREFGLSPERLLVTVYADDDEAASLWRRIAGLPESRIIRIPTADNFWRMGDTGPCGPCSEIFFDHGEAVAGGPPGSPDEDGDRFVEIWNLVFMQYEEGPPGVRNALPKPSIDTGMGLERMAAVLQGVTDNYDTDTFRALIATSAEITGEAPDGAFRTSHRVVADHVRSAAFLIADGVLPAKDGRGYVLRRIMRRAMRHLHRMGVRGEPRFHLLLPTLIRQMGAAYPELGRAEALIRETMRLEEQRFEALLDRGMTLLADETARLGEGGTLGGDVAFRLYDTYGFPLDLTEDALRETGRGVDQAGFEAAMAEQRTRARAAWAGSGERADDTSYFELRDRVGATDFLGYATEDAEAEIAALLVADMLVDRVEAGDRVAIVLNQTPFYGESGGQVGDTGTIASLPGATPGFAVEITDTVRRAGGDLVVHLGTVRAGEARVGNPARATVDHARRQAIRAHHSATHLLHEALRRRLGAHVTQKGSLNAPDRLRFDVSQPRPIARDELDAVEAEVNRRVREDTEVVTRLMTPDQAVALGAMALFGEKYGDEVRVVSMGEGDAEKNAFSIELCGGTHVARTGEIGLFRIVSESGVASGVRRIEAVTGGAAETAIRENDRLLGRLATLLRASPGELGTRIEALVEERRALTAQVSDLQRKLATGGANAEAPETVAGVAFLGRDLGEIPPRELKTLADALLASIGHGVVAAVSTADGKASLVVAVSPDLATEVDAVVLVRAGAEALGGKGGGGRRDLAQAGGPNVASVKDAIAAVRRALAEALG